jgi:redox-sensitive bicupin YhaK (pirin superfamily)
MKKKNSRRNFIQKLTAGASGLFLVPKTGISMNDNTSAAQPAVKRVKPLGFQWETMDPFLFCVHHEDFYPKGNAKMGPDASLEGRDIGQDFMVKDGWRMYHGSTVPGFPGHPHRGFETITVVRKGMVDHSDSMGASGRYGDGDVQWMTAGKGLQHAEMFPLVSQDKDNPLELFQIWLNLPKANKFTQPHFKMLWSETIPIYKHKDAQGKEVVAEVIAGSLGSNSAPTPPPNSWAAQANHEVAIWNIEMEAGAEWTLPKAAAGVNRTLYFFKGNELFIDGQKMANYHAAEVRGDVDLQLKSGSERSFILALQGKPISEPVVQHGPFVMNSREEIQQAFNDYQQTRFGGWPWPEMGPVHDRKLGRFAKHADGREEKPA